jgi:hypothetical protein
MECDFVVDVAAGRLAVARDPEQASPTPSDAHDGSADFRASAATMAFA